MSKGRHTEAEMIAALKQMAGGPAFGFEVRVAHLSRRMTDGVFDFDSLQET